MSRSPSMGIYAAVLFAVLLHALLFVMVRPVNGYKPGGFPVAPNTRFLGASGEGVSSGGSDPRLVASPVLFSLPSSMGFSRELMKQDVKTDLIFSQQVESQHFLDAGLLQRNGSFNSQELMLTSATRTPTIPSDIFQPLEKRVSARRVMLAPELMQRIVGGVVLPAELNQDVAKPWEAQAEVRVSGNGKVEHVFLKQPLESDALNLRILQLLYSLSFTEGEAVGGLVEIYSPESKATPKPEPEVEAMP